MLRVKWVRVLELQMDKTSGQLDEPLVIRIIIRPPPIPQPEMLQNVVRLVIALRVEALEITEIASVVHQFPASLRDPESAEKSFHAPRLVHSDHSNQESRPLQGSMQGICSDISLPRALGGFLIIVQFMRD